MSLTVGSLFSGIGGLDLGLERAGMTVIWQSEIDPYASRVLAKHWPTVPNLGDITTIDWSTVESVDIVAGGYPCQPFSFSGVRRGASDPRHLWPHMLNAVRLLRPRYVLAENVPGHLSLGFDRVLADLAEIGFDVEWSLVSACSMGAPHPRERLFWVAYTSDRDEPDQMPHHQRPPITHESRGGRGGARRDGWLPEPGVGRVAHGVPSRLVRGPLSALGNAVVPAVAQWVGERIVEAAA